jgi:ABC-type proline/glycine betaine transport system substrate-binding protein
VNQLAQAMMAVKAPESREPEQVARGWLSGKARSWKAKVLSQ